MQPAANRLSDRITELEQKHLDFVSAALQEARRMLFDNPRPDTSLGRKTHEPFPREDDL